MSHQKQTIIANRRNELFSDSYQAHMV